MQRHVDRALRPEIGVGVPGDIAEQAGRQPQPLHIAGFVREQRIHPHVERRAMVAEAAQPIADLERRREQRIFVRGSTASRSR